MYFKNRAFRDYYSYYLINNLSNKQIIAYPGVEEYLYKKLFDISVRTLVTEMYKLKSNNELSGNDTYERYNSFEAKFRDEKFVERFINKYPILDEKIIKIIKNTENYISEIIYAFEKDIVNLQQIFDKRITRIERIELGEGDTHNNGRSVAIIITNSSKIVYKPHALVGDELMEKIVQFINPQVKGYELETLKYYSGDIYGWQEYIDYSGVMSKMQAKEYYKKCGIFLCIFYVLGTTDIHFENVIVNNGNPYFIDLETITSAPKILESSSVLESAYIPRIMAKDVNVFDFDISGLCATGNVKSKIKTINVVDEFTDSMRVENVEITVDLQSNRVLIDGNIAKIEDYNREVIEGFSIAWNTISNNKEKIVKLVATILGKAKYCGRVVLRSTQIYQKFLIALTHPDFLSSSDERNVILNKLIIGKNITEINRMKDEIRQLENLDVPYYYINFQDRRIFSGDGIWKEEYNKFTPQEGIEYRINHMTEKNKKIQIDIIDKSLFTAYSDKEQKPYYLIEAGIIERTYPQIVADRLVSHIIGDGKSLTMITNTVVDEDYGINTLTLDIPEGGGIVWFIYNVGKYYKNEKYSKVAIDLFKCGELYNRYMPNNKLTAFRGDGAIVYLSYNMWILTKDDYFYEVYNKYLEQILDNINSLNHSEWRNYSVSYYDGLSGIVTLLCNIYIETKNKKILHSLNIVVKIIIQNIELKKAGFFEGISGVVYALSKYDSVCNSNIYEELCFDLLNKEYEMFRDDEKNLGIGTGWTGILYVSKYISEVYKKIDFNSQIEKIYNQITNIQMPYINNIMNGIIGIKELTSRIDIKTEYKKRINEIKEYENFGYKNNFLIESFMLGATGVAYSHLNNEVKTLPSVVLLEVCR